MPTSSMRWEPDPEIAAIVRQRYSLVLPHEAIRSDDPVIRVLCRVRLVGECWMMPTPSYAYIGMDGKQVLVHRMMYEHFVGRIPDGCDVDHVCRHPPCCNPNHLEAVTHRENLLRGHSPVVILHREGVCSRGHEVNEANTYRRPNGYRVCRVCQRDQDRRRYARKRHANT